MTKSSCSVRQQSPPRHFSLPCQQLPGSPTTTSPTRPHFAPRQLVSSTLSRHPSFPRQQLPSSPAVIPSSPLASPHMHAQLPTSPLRPANRPVRQPLNGSNEGTVADTPFVSNLPIPPAQITTLPFLASFNEAARSPAPLHFASPSTRLAGLSCQPLSLQQTSSPTPFVPANQGPRQQSLFASCPGANSTPITLRQLRSSPALCSLPRQLLTLSLTAGPSRQSEPSRPSLIILISYVLFYVMLFQKLFIKYFLLRFS